jgi:hypothetical protein
MPLMVRSLSSVFSFNSAAVAESSEIPPLPVSRMKLSVSGKLLSRAFTIMMPPVNILKALPAGERILPVPARPFLLRTVKQTWVWSAIAWEQV